MQTIVTDALETLRSPERVLSTIAATARLEGMAAPRWLSFDEPRDGEPLAVLSLTWKSLDAMRPWLEFFAAEPLKTYRRDTGTVHYSAWADYHGWNVALNAIDSVRCVCGTERVHLVGCPADETKQCPATWYGGWCPGEVRHDDGRCDTHTSHNLTYDEPTVEVVPVITGTPAEVAEHLADHFSLRVDDPIPYVPTVHWITASGRNMCFDRSVESYGTRDGAKATCPDCREVYSYTAEALDTPIGLVPVDFAKGVTHLAAGSKRGSVCQRFEFGHDSFTDRAEWVTCAPCITGADLPQRIPGAALAAEPPPDDDTFTAETIAHRHDPVPVVEVLTVDPDLTDDGRGGAGLARIGVPVDLTCDTGVTPC